MQPLIKTKIDQLIKESLPSWRLDKNCLCKDFKFRNFVDAFSFMTAIALEAEKTDHHPNWKNVYNEVSISLNTHSAGGVTEKDFKLAGKIEEIYAKYAEK
ncbi:MAG: 4a-hydroxytetrahydrobiopterin dehydratase [Flavobacteriales bacterium]|jgi:4a-hydroxytetrahydrobiopterin dehydratase|tara:strand:- start:944 stop:1243 length:300 start_codon:yes stop_codon:yes gene_type:complete